MEGLGISARQLTALRELRFGYIPYQAGAQSPGDRRRFPLVARKLGLDWELARAGERYDVLYATSNADLTALRRRPRDGTQMVFEMVDSYLDSTSWDSKTLIRGLGKWVLRKHQHLELDYRRTVGEMCRRADLVLCSMPEQRVEIERWNNNAHAILDFHEELGEVPKLAQVAGSPTVDLFWEGLGLSAPQFASIAEVLVELATLHPLRLHLVTDLNFKRINAPVPASSTRKVLKRILGPVEFYLAEWNPASVRALASQCTLGLIPICLDQTVFQAKPENKLLIMWRLGLPAVVSATPAYSRTMAAYGGPDWACRDQNQWYRTLSEALEQPELRRAASERGQSYAEAEFGEARLLRRWCAALATLLTL